MTTQDERLLLSILQTADAKTLMRHHSDDFRFLRDFVWRRCVQLSYSCVLRTFVSREKDYELEYADLCLLAKRRHVDVLSLIARKASFTISRKRNVFSHLFARGEEVVQLAKDYTE